MKITVNKCPHTGILIENDKEYRRHLRHQQTLRREDLQREQFKSQMDDFIAPLFALSTAEDISQWLTNNYWTIARQAGYRCNQWRAPGSKYYQYHQPGPEDKVLITIGSLKFKDDLRTTHSAPRGQPTTGWRGGDHYAEIGWEGYILIKFEGNAYDYFSGDHLKTVAVHTGSGGGNPKGSRYGVTLYAKDFAAMRRLEVMNKLAGDTSDKFKYNGEIAW
jgi:hypothetical protein